MSARRNLSRCFAGLLAVLVALFVAGGLFGCNADGVDSSDVATGSETNQSMGSSNGTGHISLAVDTGGAPTDDWPLFIYVEGLGDQQINPAGGTVVDVVASDHTLRAANEFFIASDGTLLQVADVSPSKVSVDSGATVYAEVTLEKVDPSATERAAYQADIDSAYEYLLTHVATDRADELKASAERLLPPENAPPADNGSLTATFIDVGQGDATLLQLPDGKNLLVDAGPSSGVDAVISVLSARGISRIDYLVATHPDADHIGGMATVIGSFDIGEIWAPNATNNTLTFEAFLDAIEAKGLTITAGYRGRDIVPDDGSSSYSVTTLGPASQADTTNESSLVLRVGYGSTSFLLTGDADADDIASDVTGHVDVLKVSHHGSRTGTTLALARELTPKVAVISYEMGNSYGHPTQECLDDLSAVGAAVYGTGANGNVTVTSDGTNVTASCERQGTVVAGSTGSGNGSAASSTTTTSGSGSSSSATTSSASSAATAASTSDSTETVYVTPYGEKYHRAGCRYLKKSNGGTAISKASALAQGYTACKVCRP